MRITATSDIHHRYKTCPDLPGGDVLIVAGDVCMMGTMIEFLAFSLWFNRQPYEHRLYVPGNHDIIVQSDPSLCAGMIDGKLLIDECTEIDGVKIYGSPYTPEFCEWAFMLPHQWDLEEKWALIPDDTDILVTHGPPKGILDRVAGKYESVGCIELRKRVDKIRPSFHIFGHVHGDYGSKTVAGTTYLNVSMCDERYDQSHPIVEITYEK